MQRRPARGAPCLPGLGERRFRRRVIAHRLAHPRQGEQPDRIGQGLAARPLQPPCRIGPVFPAHGIHHEAERHQSPVERRLSAGRAFRRRRVQGPGQGQARRRIAPGNAHPQQPALNPGIAGVRLQRAAIEIDRRREVELPLRIAGRKPVVQGRRGVRAARGREQKRERQEESTHPAGLTYSDNWGRRRLPAPSRRCSGSDP